MRVWIALGILVLLIISVNLGGAVFANKNCPKKIYGKGETAIKYFSSPLCPSCWLQKPIIEKMAAEESNFLLEEYSAEFCREAAEPHYIQGVPAFMTNGRVIYGLQTEEALKRMIA